MHGWPTPGARLRHVCGAVVSAQAMRLAHGSPRSETSAGARHPGRLASPSISTSAPTARAVTPTVVRAGSRPGAKKLS